MRKFSSQSRMNHGQQLVAQIICAVINTSTEVEISLKGCCDPKSSETLSQSQKSVIQLQKLQKREFSNHQIDNQSNINPQIPGNTLQDSCRFCRFLS